MSSLSLIKSYQVLSSLIKSYQVLSSLIKSYQVLSSLIKSYQVLSSQYNVQFVKNQILKISKKTKQETNSFFAEGKTILKSFGLRFATKRKPYGLSALYQIRTRFEHGFSLCNEVLLQVNAILVLNWFSRYTNMLFLYSLSLFLRPLSFLRLQLSFLRRQESRPTSTRTPLDSRFHGNDRVWSFPRQLSLLCQLSLPRQLSSFPRQLSLLCQLSLPRQPSFPRRRESRKLLSSVTAWFSHLVVKLSFFNSTIKQI